jgi:hypothetical protein
MATTYDAKRREERDGKTYWRFTGFSVVRYEKDGEQRMMLVDDRSGIVYPLFERKPRQQTDDAPY